MGGGALFFTIPLFFLLFFFWKQEKKNWNRNSNCFFFFWMKILLFYCLFKKIVGHVAWSHPTGTNTAASLRKAHCTVEFFFSTWEKCCFFFLCVCVCVWCVCGTVFFFFLWKTVTHGLVVHMLSCRCYLNVHVFFFNV